MKANQCILKFNDQTKKTTKTDSSLKENYSGINMHLIVAKASFVM